MGRTDTPDRRSGLTPADLRAEPQADPQFPAGPQGADGYRLAFADLHNHSLLSDGRGDPEQAFEQLRAAGLDVAALTDHASIPHDRLGELSLAQYPDRAALAVARTAPRSFDAEGWKRTGALADAHDVPGEFTALRGFEWTEPWLGHVNVWFSDQYLQVTTPGSLSGLQDWLQGTEPEALFGFNHPGREPGRLGDFALLGGTGLAERMVSLEAFNRSEDFLFAGHGTGLGSPLAACLNRGWRAALIGSSDEHGREYGLVGKGRTGLWVRELSRDGVREALVARRAFATREAELRLDATLDGVRMGGVLPPAAGRTGARGHGGAADHGDAHGGGQGGGVDGSRVLRRLAVDLHQPGRDGHPVELQLLASGEGSDVAVLALVPAQFGTVTRAEISLPEQVSWLLLRVADPARGYGGPTPHGHPASNWGLAYGSPWWAALP